MSVRLDINKIVTGSFGGLEPAVPDALDQCDYWEDFNTRFFRSNGEGYDPATQSNVKAWLAAADRASFAAMTGALLPEMRQQHGLDDVDLVLLAHWLPDLHLGTSVTNYALHALGIENGFGFAISDRGLSAPLFAMDCAARYLKDDRKKALLMVMDQKHLLYRSDAVDALEPQNSAALMVLERDGTLGHEHLGYTRRTDVSDADLGHALTEICADFGMDPAQTVLVADPASSMVARGFALTHETEPTLLCSAPFAALQITPEEADHLLVIREGTAVYATALASPAKVLQ